jgi:hypothetical protein
VRIESLAGGPCSVIVPDWDSAFVRGRGGKRIVKNAAGAFVLDIPKGGSVVISPDLTTPLPQLTPVARPVADNNPWPPSKR